MTYQEAAEKINAVEIAPDTWEYEAKEIGVIFTLTGADLEALADYLSTGDPDGYSLWCAAGYGEWTRFAEGENHD